MKRAAVYFFYDRDGIVDRYVPYFIRELHKVVDYIVVVVNGKLLSQGRKVLTDVADDLFVRKNEGLDAWAYKDALEYIGWDCLAEYDELVLVNATMFGPFFPFEQIFNQMETSECDFWGMMTGYENRSVKNWGGIPLKWGYRPDYLVSNFQVFKRTVLHSYEFRDHWNQLKEIQNYFQSGVYHEFELTQKLVDAGFIWEAADKGAFRNLYANPTVNGAYDMICQYHVPVVRKKAFYDPNSSLDQCTNIPRRLMHFLESETDYDCNLILESLLRTTNQYDLKNWFNWNRILYSHHKIEKKCGLNVAVIFHVYYIGLVEQYIDNLKSFPDGTHIYFTTDTSDKIEKLKQILHPHFMNYQIEYRQVRNQGGGVSALLIGCRDVILNESFDLICFMEIKNDETIEFESIQRDYLNACFENISGTPEYVSNVIDLFEQQPKLGIAVPPPPKNEANYERIGGSWNCYYKNTVKLLSDLSISLPIDENKPPVVPYGAGFWFRVDALKPLFEHLWVYEDFLPEIIVGNSELLHAIEHGYSLIAQSEGYYPQIIMNTTYAEQEVTRMTEIAHNYVDLTIQYVGRKDSMRVATAQLKKKLNALSQASGKQYTDSRQMNKKRSLLKTIVRGICPIGLWNLFRRIHCLAAGGIYLEPRVKRGAFKTVIRACMPRFLWDQLRKAKCKKNGWIFVAD